MIFFLSDQIYSQHFFNVYCSKLMTITDSKSILRLLFNILLSFFSCNKKTLQKDYILAYMVAWKPNAVDCFCAALLFFIWKLS